ncbi:hypothetical protein BCV72DRAFT_117433 [Rhizopus microsporus var. microsporus]|uniref:Uncharacterized protein n=1 Tax=Rhizopus microsporus var. microsporus TaxID=86635 RepID=A0A1X0R4K8_RHIZD|nr:hypothetical protein BCV72DRAFT_117433 [Rhizopus microsporus var. microsporus]
MVLRSLLGTSRLPLFVELSEGIDFNTHKGKETVDEEKMMKQLIKLLKLKQVEGSEDPIQYYKRYYGEITNIIYFIPFNSSYLRLETLPRVIDLLGLQEFLIKTSELFQYREAILKEINI